MCSAGLAEEVANVGRNPRLSTPMTKALSHPPGPSRKTHAFARKGVDEVENRRDCVEAVSREEVASGEEVAAPVILLHRPQVETSARAFSVG